MVTTTASFHSDFRRRQLGDEGNHLRRRRLIRNTGRFGRINADAFILGRGRLRSGFLTAPSLARDAVGPSI
jgi:hypothetical protein